MREGVGPKAYALGGLLWLPVPIIAGFLGLAAPALGIGISQPDTVGPLVAATLLGTGGAMLVFVVVFCSLASSIDSLLAATSDLLVNDIAEPIVGGQVSDAQKRRWSMFAIVALGVLAWSIAWPNVGTLATVLFFAGPMVGSCIWPIVGGLYFRQASPLAACLAMLAGSGCGLIAYFAIGWFVASLVGAAVSGVVFGITVHLAPGNFDFRSLAAQQLNTPAGDTTGAAR
jgi:Na+/proline symporter